MATCNDCLHLDVCYMVEHYGVDVTEDGQEYDCHQFQDHTKYVEVVRCKDCKHYKRICEESNRFMCMITHGLIAPKADDFCSYGERIDHEKKTD